MMKPGMRSSNIRSSRGIALVMALIITLVAFLMIVSTLYVITSSLNISGAGKRYATASEAADGAAEASKEAITLIWRLEDPPSLFPSSNCDEGYTISTAVQTRNSPCTETLSLPSAMGTSYTAKVTIEYLYGMGQAGSRIEFPPRFVAGMSGYALYYRIVTIVTGPNNTSAENSVLYRFTG